MRDPDLPPPLAAHVFVCRAPLETPTGRYLGIVGYPASAARGARKAPGRCIDEDVEPVEESLSDREVAVRLAAYDVVSLAVIDEAHRLVGAVTIDDVLDRLLPADWRATLTESG